MGIVDLDMKTLLLDCETTGLIDNRTIRDEKLPEIIELYACLADTQTGEVFEEIDTLVKPRNMDFEAKITKITGIRRDMLFDAPAFNEIVGRFGDLVVQADRVIAHNCSFDCEVLDIEHGRLGLRVDWPEKVCTVEQTLHIKGHRLSLAALHEYLFGERFDGAHRAKVDVMALLRCVTELEKRDLL